MKIKHLYLLFYYCVWFIFRFRYEDGRENTKISVRINMFIIFIKHFYYSYNLLGFPLNSHYDTLQPTWISLKFTLWHANCLNLQAMHESVTFLETACLSIKQNLRLYQTSRKWSQRFAPLSYVSFKLAWRLNGRLIVDATAAVKTSGHNRD